MSSNGPIFILPGGGRTGSTWMARYLSSTKGVLIWGETGILRLFADYSNNNPWTFERSTGKDTDLHYFREHGPNMWAAKLKPFESDLHHGWKTMLEETFGRAALREGFFRWGLKEVHWQFEDLKFIRESWKDYRVVFLIRDFLACYRSSLGTGWLSGVAGRSWFIQEWLDHNHMIANMNFKALGKERVFRYEELVKDPHPLLVWSNLLPPITTTKWIGASSASMSQQDWDILSDRLREVNSLQKQLGYPEITKASLNETELKIIK